MHYKWCILTLLIFCTAKKVESVINLSTNQLSSYFTKFSVPPGEAAKCTFTAKLRSNISNLVNVDFLLYDDVVDYQKITEMDNCSQKLSLVSYFEKRTIPFNKWSAPAEIKIKPRQSATTYFIEVSDCELRKISKIYPSIDVQGVCVNGENNQYSYEDMNNLSIYTVLFLGVFALLIYNIRLLINEIKKGHEYLLILLFTIIVAVYSCSLGSKVLHFRYYYQDGEGSPFFELLSIILEIAAQLGMVILLICIAWGWMFLFKQVGDLDIYIPIFSLVLMAHILTGALTYINHDDYNKFHEYQGVQGMILVVIRIALYIAFIVGYRDTYNKIIQQKRKATFYKYGVYSSAFILALPILVIVSGFFSNYHRQKIVVVGGNLMQAASIYFCQKLFVTKGDFYEASQLSKSDLPK
jgi:hypothetical protein